MNKTDQLASRYCAALAREYNGVFSTTHTVLNTCYGECDSAQEREQFDSAVKNILANPNWRKTYTGE